MNEFLGWISIALFAAVMIAVLVLVSCCLVSPYPYAPGGVYVGGYRHEGGWR
jgi:hypothetical protein